MKQFYKIFLFPFLWIINSLGLSAQGNYTLTIQITGLQGNKGTIMLQLTDAKGNVLTEKMGTIVNEKSTIIINDVKAVTYTIRYFHDENSNKKMDFNFAGIPLEGFGFSNNAKKFMGEPSFESRLFEVKCNLRVSLKPSYIL